MTSNPESETTGRRIRLVTGDGAAIVGRRYEPAAEAVRTILVLPGVAIPQTLYAGFAEWLCQQGRRVITIDYRGIGESRGPEASVGDASLSVWAGQDAVAAFRYAESLGSPVAIVGHSFGGQVMGLADDFARAESLTLVASQFGYWRDWPGMNKWRVAYFWFLGVPVGALFGEAIPPWLGLGTSLPTGVGREWARWGRSPNYLLDHVPEAAERYARLTMPKRVFSFDDDELAPEQAARRIVDCLPRHNLRYAHLKPKALGVDRIGHYGFFKPGRVPTLWEDVLDHLDERGVRLAA